MLVDQTTVVVAVSLLIAAYIKGTTGMGFPLIATPMVALLLDIRTAITILIIPNIVMDATQIFRGGFSVAIFRRFVWLLVLTVIGVFLGTTVLVMLPIWVLTLSLGPMFLAFALSRLFRFDFAISPRMEPVFSPAAGLAGGVFNGATQELEKS